MSGTSARIGRVSMAGPSLQLSSKMVGFGSVLSVLYHCMTNGFRISDAMHCAEVCCSFLFLNPQGQAECRFMGAAQGTCDTLLAET